MTTLARPRRLNQMESLRPGKEGSVGDVVLSTKLKTSFPDAPLRMEKANVNDGSIVTGQPYVYDSNWNMGRNENFAYGMRQQDLRAPDKLHEPTLQSVPQYSYRNKVATVYEAKRTGNKFLPLPGPYALARGEMLRGGQVVRTTDIEGLFSVVESQQDSPSLGLARQNDALFRRMYRGNSGGLGGKKNFGKTTPMVVNVPATSLNSTNGNFRLADPQSLATRL